MKEEYYSIYVLFNDNKPIYIGCTTNIKKRITGHLRSKKFDSYQLIYQHGNKKAALLFENACIHLLDVLFSENYNKQKIFYSNERVYL